MKKRINKEIALELLYNYIDDEISIMYEYSWDFDNSKRNIEKKALKYLKELDAMDLYEEYKRKIWDLY